MIRVDVYKYNICPENDDRNYILHTMYFFDIRDFYNYIGVKGKYSKLFQINQFIKYRFKINKIKKSISKDKEKKYKIKYDYYDKEMYDLATDLANKEKPKFSMFNYESYHHRSTRTPMSKVKKNMCTDNYVSFD